MAKPLSNTPIDDEVMSPAEADPIVARYAISEARLGNPHPLLSRLQADTLTETEREFIVKNWGKPGILGKRGRAYIRGVRNALICMSVEALEAAHGSTEAAVTEIIQRHGLKRRAVFGILKKCNLIV
jgi:hypothetical protein